MSDNDIITEKCQTALVDLLAKSGRISYDEVESKVRTAITDALADEGLAFLRVTTRRINKKISDSKAMPRVDVYYAAKLQDELQLITINNEWIM